MLIIEKLPTRYSEGSATVVANEVTVTPTNALWYGNVWGDDLFFDPAQPLVPPQRIASVNEDGTLTLAYPWPGDTMTEAPYEVRYIGIIERSTAQTRRVIEQLGEVDAYFDVQVDELADRATYDDRPAGYRVLVSNTGDGRAAIYSKNSATSGDWSDPAYVTGPVGPEPEITIGTVTRGDADVTSTPVTGGYELDFTIPSQVAQGDYSGATAYVTGDIVQDQGSSWVALQATTGNAPPTLPTTSNAYWQLLARAGNDGAGTVTTLVPGDGIDIDSTDPTMPVVSGVLFGIDAQGDVPGPTAGDVSAGRVLSADGTWVDVSTDPWSSQPIGVPIPIFTHLVGVEEPPTDQSYRYVKLTASDAYNMGVLTGESVTGSAPLVIATAVIDDAASPLDGETVQLINTERRALRAGSSGTVQNDQMQQITGQFRRSHITGLTDAESGDLTGAFSAGTSYPAANTAASGTTNYGINFDSANSPNARTGDETRSKNIGADYYMRIR